MTKKLLCALMALFPLITTEVKADDFPLTAKTLDILQDFDSLTSIPIVVLDRYDDDPAAFWNAAMKKLCARTGDNWCDDQLTEYFTDTTNLMGWSRILSYTNSSGVSKKVCAVLQPKTNISPSYVASALGNDTIFDWQNLPTSDESSAFLMLMHIASCANTDGGDLDTKNADAFASLTLTLMEGSATFVNNSAITPARKFALFTDHDVIRWSVNIGERLLLDLWKGQTATLLRSAGCTVTVPTETNISTDTISRDTYLPDGQNCSVSTGGYGTVTDENLWLWTNGSYGISRPPTTYTYFQMFSSESEAIAYIWPTAKSIASQK